MSVALLANCGLHAPARAASVPLFDAFTLRMTSSDAPSDDLSHFKRDMTEAATVLRDSSAGSLVMLDELGQGTEGRHAAAIGAAILAKLDEIVRTRPCIPAAAEGPDPLAGRRAPSLTRARALHHPASSAQGCRGFFSTHLHEMLLLDGGLRNTARAPPAAPCSGTHRPRPLQPFLLPLTRQPRGCVPSHPAAKNAPQTEKRMEVVRDAAGRLRPTWRMLDGRCTESLAFEVAADCCIPEDVVGLAERFYGDLQRRREGGAGGGGGRLEGEAQARGGEAGGSGRPPAAPDRPPRFVGAGARPPGAARDESRRTDFGAALQARTRPRPSPPPPSHSSGLPDMLSGRLSPLPCCCCSAAGAAGAP